MLSRISDAKNKRLGPESFDAHATSYADRTIAKIFRRYEEIMKEYNALDFDDLLLAMLRVLEEREDVREDLRARFRYVMVDEYQDTNRPQYEIANLLAGKNGNLCVVGDPDQSIYKWRGADIRNILDFERDFPDAVTVKLERNYRSTQVILDAASAVVSHNRGRKDKVLWTDQAGGAPIVTYRGADELDEADFIVKVVRRRFRPTTPPRPPSSTAPTRSRGRWKTACARPASRIRCSAAPASTNAARSRTHWPT